MQWRSYGDERAWQRAASDYEAQLATFSAEAPVVVTELSNRGRVKTFNPLRRAIAATLLIVGLASTMAGSAQSASLAVQSTEAAASRLPVAASPQAAEANANVLAPRAGRSVASASGSLRRARSWTSPCATPTARSTRSTSAWS